MKTSYAIICLFLLLSFLLLFSLPKEEKYSVSSENIISYENRPMPKYNEQIIESSQTSFLSKVSYDSRGQKIYALLSIPKSQSKLPAFVVLPGAMITKEGEQGNIARDLNSMGFATITLDQRGTGETIGGVNSLDQDFLLFNEGKEPTQHMMVHDALVAFDILAGRPEINRDKIYFSGISMGGRIAIMAGAIEKQSKGVLAVATSGYGLPEVPDADQKKFLRSMDPDNYINLISPRKLDMIHSKNDTVIPIQNAEKTFSKALEPKKFYTVEKSQHGYHRSEMKAILEKELEGWK
ncbi:MAG: alpha/beta fold hydrolase [Candidatus Aenigmarchaeota archaeon]|nr:alpha/beta fold hydrolase [Candidatus Aenigmarchaeota archaeon]